MQEDVFKAALAGLLHDSNTSYVVITRCNWSVRS